LNDDIKKLSEQLQELQFAVYKPAQNKLPNRYYPLKDFAVGEPITDIGRAGVIEAIRVGEQGRETVVRYLNSLGGQPPTNTFVWKVYANYGYRFKAPRDPATDKVASA